MADNAETITDSYRNLPEEKRPKIVETGDYVLYVPSGLDMQRQHALLVALSPGADAWGMIRVWQAVAEKHKWLLYASKVSHNGAPYEETFKILVPSIKAIIAGYPVIPSKVIATGFSGGGMTSHALSCYYPKLIAAVIVNTGMIWDEKPTLEDMLRDDAPHYPHDKIAAFLASPTDFRFETMKRDRLFLEQLGWKTHWLEFQGGHTIAPAATLDEAAEWVAQELHVD